jgi:hypothetical protein
MPLGDLLPWITGGGGAIVVMAVGWWLLLSEKIVTGSEHKRVLEQNEKLEQANDALRASNSSNEQQVRQLLSGSQLTNQLVTALIGIAGHAPVTTPLPETAGEGT